MTSFSATERALLREADAIRRRERKADKKARPKSVKADRGRVRDNAHLAWIRRQPCCVGPVGCGGPTEAAHVRLSAPGEPPTGLQVKPSDFRCVPLCADHHRMGADPQHGRGNRAVSERVWWAKHGVSDPLKLAATYAVRSMKEALPGRRAAPCES